MSSTIVELENEIKKIQEDMKQIHTEFSILMEFYAETRQFLSELIQLSKNKTNQELENIKGFSLLNYENQESRSQSSRKSVIDAKLEKTIDLIFRDYKTQGQRQGE